MSGGRDNLAPVKCIRYSNRPQVKEGGEITLLRGKRSRNKIWRQIGKNGEETEKGSNGKRVEKAVLNQNSAKPGTGIKMPKVTDLVEWLLQLFLTPMFRQITVLRHKKVVQLL